MLIFASKKGPGDMAIQNEIKHNAYFTLNRVNRKQSM